MAKRTRYPNRTTARPVVRRTSGPEGPATETGIRSIAREPELIDAQLANDLADESAMRPASSGLTDAELRRAEALEAEATAKEKAAIAESLRRRNRGATDDLTPVADVNAPLSVRMSHEYDYVARDVKRIALTGGLMVAILAVLDILVNVAGVIKL